MSRRKSRASSSFGCAEKMTSACRAAKSRPSGESPAWNSTGRYWALRGSRGHVVHGVVLALVVHGPGRTGRGPGGGSRRFGDGAVLPGVPDPLGGFDECFGVDVPVRVVQVAAAAEVRAGPGVVRGDDVPGRAAAGEQVQGGQPVRQVRGVVVRGVLGGHQADVGGHGGQGGQHGLRVRPAGDVQRVRAAEVLAQPQPFAEEERGEQAALGGLGDAAERLEVRLRSGLRRLPDGAGVHALEEDAELQLAGRHEAVADVCVCHGSLPSYRPRKARAQWLTAAAAAA